MSNLNKKEREKFYELLVQRDGEYCQLCGKTKKEAAILEIHETKYDRPLQINNMKLLCHGCNHNPSLTKSEIYQRDPTPEHKKNIEKEPFFRQWLYGKLLENNYHYPYDEVIDSGAYVCGVSTETIKRYLRPLMSDEGYLSKPMASQSGELHVYIKGKEPFYHQ